MTNTYEIDADPLESEDLNLKRDELRKYIKLYYESLDGYDLISDSALGFKKEHPDAYDYILFHDLIGSTPPKYVTKFDMPNNEIEKLILDLPKKLQEMNTHKKAA